MVIVHPECINCVMLIIYEWGHGWRDHSKQWRVYSNSGIRRERGEKESPIERKKERKSQFHQLLHSNHLRHSLNLAELIRMLVQLPQDLVALLGRGGREGIVADSGHAGYDGDDLGEVLLERLRRCQAWTPDRTLCMA